MIRCARGGGNNSAFEALQQLDVAAFIVTGALSVDVAAARIVAQTALVAQVPMASIMSVTARGYAATIAPHQDVELPFDFFPERTVHLRASASAGLASGYVKPGSLSLP